MKQVKPSTFSGIILLKTFANNADKTIKLMVRRGGVAGRSHGTRAICYGRPHRPRVRRDHFSTY